MQDEFKSTLLLRLFKLVTTQGIFIYNRFTAHKSMDKRGNASWVLTLEPTHTCTHIQAHRHVHAHTAACTQRHKAHTRTIILTCTHTTHTQKHMCTCTYMHEYTQQETKEVTQLSHTPTNEEVLPAAWVGRPVKITRQRLLMYDSQMGMAWGTVNSNPSSRVRERNKLGVEKPQASYDMLSRVPCKTEGNNPLRNTQNSSQTQGSNRVGLAHLFRTGREV